MNNAIIDMVQCHHKYHHVVPKGSKDGSMTFLQPVWKDKLSIKHGKEYLDIHSVAQMKRFLIEDDTNPIDEQTKVLELLKTTYPTPSMAVFSGNKSIHMVFEQQTPSRNLYEYKQQFEWLCNTIKMLTNLEGLHFTPDPSNSPVKKFRTPNYTRSETGKIQRLMWLAKEEGYGSTLLPTFDEPKQANYVSYGSGYRDHDYFLNKGYSKYNFGGKGKRYRPLTQFIGYMKTTCPDMSKDALKSFVNSKAGWASYENNRIVDGMWDKR